MVASLALRPFGGLRTRVAAAGTVMRQGPMAAMQQQKRHLSIHEYLSMELLGKYGVAVPRSVAAKTPEEAFEAAKSFKGKGMVIKAQVLAGGRGKGHFDSGLQGGVHLIKTPEEARDYAKKMIGNKLITKQTGAGGRICNAIMLAEARPPAHEYYVALLNDRATQLPVLIASNQGGMSIEDVAAENPDAIITTPISFEKGLDQKTALDVAKKLGFSSEKQEKQAADTFIKLYKLFKDKDATQVEINPMAESKDGEVLCMDAKLGFDDNAVEIRQPDIAKLRDPTQEDPDEVEAGKKGLNFIKLDGDIGCLVNGAGLAMATMDVVKLNGGNPANFLDIGGGADAEAMKLAFKLLLSANPKALFVNVFGGIVSSGKVAEALVEAAKSISSDVNIDIVARLRGNQEGDAKKVIESFDQNSGVKIHPVFDLDDAAKMVVKLADEARAK